MNVQISDLPTQLQALFTTDADDAAVQAKLIQRQRKLTPAAFAQGLVFGWLQLPDANVPQLTTLLARSGVSLRPQSLEARFTPEAADFFTRLLGKALLRTFLPRSKGVGLLNRFNGVYLIDGTSIALPDALAERLPGCGGRGGSGKASLKVMVRFEVSGGVIDGLSLHPGKTADARTPEHTDPLPPRSLRVADLAFFDLKVLADCAAKGAFYLTRLQSRSVVFDRNGRKWSLGQYLAKQTVNRLDRELWLGSGKRLAGRLLAIRAPQGVQDGRQKAAEKVAKDAGSQVTEGTLTVCGWTVFFTNVPRWLLSLQEAWVMYRVRWQIELLFKLWKSDCKVDESRSVQPERVLCEVLAKLLGMVVQHWLLLACDGASMTATSRRQAARAVRLQVGHVAGVLGDRVALKVALLVMAMMVATAAPVAKREGRPATFQTLLDPYDDGLSAEAGQDSRGVPSFEDP